jgi:hypothetical protein
VSTAHPYVRHHKLQTDRVISHNYRCVARQPGPSAAFTELLHCARRRAPRILSAPAAPGTHSGVEALANLARFSTSYVRSPGTWPGADSSWRGAVASLAQHLLGRYPVPRFLAAAWYARGGFDPHAKRRWFLAHAAGARFRSLDLPLALTRRMEHILLASPDHLDIEEALRRAELLGLGASPALVHAVLETPVGVRLTHGGFWRPAWRFLVAHQDTIRPAQVAPVIDFLDEVRRERPGFSLEGRTPRSLLRLVDGWHRGLWLGTGEASWSRSGLRPMVADIPHAGDDPAAPRRWYELVELTNEAALRAEGAALHHCVASYGRRCLAGASRIWSLRFRREATVRPMLTIEVDLARRAVVQARGSRNRQPSPALRRLLETWADREGLRIVAT